MSLEMRALFGDDFEVRSEIGHWLFMCRYLRALRSWIKPGAYAWWRLTDDLKAAQRKLAEFRLQRVQ